MKLKLYRVCLVIAGTIIIFAPVTTYSEPKFTTVVKISEVNKQEITKQDDVQIKIKNYTDEDLDLLARLINCECGSDWQSDEFKLKVANVVLNRVKDGRFPDSIYDVVYQKGQYYCVRSGAINSPPSEKSLEIARRLLEGETVLPDNIIWQSESKQGNGIYDTYYDEVLGSTTYFCY